MRKYSIHAAKNKPSLKKGRRQRRKDRAHARPREGDVNRGRGEESRGASTCVHMEANVFK
jgi:hypothetical protein